MTEKEQENIDFVLTQGGVMDWWELTEEQHAEIKRMFEKKGLADEREESDK